MRRQPLQRRFWALICLLVALSPLSGCWDQRQIADLVVVLGVGVDLAGQDEAVDGENILLTVELAHITTQNSDGAPVLLTASGKTLLDAVRNLAQSLDHQLHFSHMQLLLIGDAAARAGVDQFLSLFYNNKEMSPHIYFALCEGQAREILTGQAGLSPYASGGLHDILLKQQNQANGYVIPVSLQRYMSEHSLPRCGVLVPLVAVREAEEEPGGVLKQLFGTEQARDKLYFKGMAVLDGNAKYVGQLTAVENSGAALFLNQQQNFVLALTEPNMKQQVSVELKQWRAEQEWQFGSEQGQIKLTLLCTAKGELVDEQEATDYSDEDAVRHLEELFAAELKRQLRLAWIRAQLLEVDFLGLGREIYRHHPQKWNSLLPDWPRGMQNIQLEIEIKTKIDVAGQSR